MTTPLEVERAKALLLVCSTAVTCVTLHEPPFGPESEAAIRDAIELLRPELAAAFK